MAEQSTMATPIFDELVAELNQDATFAERLDALPDEKPAEQVTG